ncbi:MAG: iron ABC transporter permease [Propionibacteriaceae bacterium]|jgi:iron complex transport system permease protein|nr:iron ABC transporter permease [Propionibacteriaceae bacterium]
MAHARQRRGERGLARWAGQLVFPALALVVMVVAVSLGSVSVPLGQTVEALWRAATGQPQPDRMIASIIVSTRLPRVICAALIGAGLSVGGAAMQGLLKNPLADGSTLGVSGGAALGAVVAIAFGLTLPGLPFGSVMVMAMVFAFLSLVIIMGLAYRLDNSLSTNTIILLGVIFSMFVSSIVSLLITFSDDKIHSITFWLMGSLAGANLNQALALAGVLAVGATAIVACGRELNAFAVGEDNARQVGIDVRRIKVVVLVSVSALIGVCVAVGGSIAFVGLVTPHMVRLLVGPNHRRLLPASLFGGAAFLMLADLVARTVLSPRELPIGVVTSFIGAIFFLTIFWRARKGV